MRTVLSFALLLTSTNLANAAAIPAAPRVAFHETVYDIALDDPYRWMEDPARKSEMVAWVEAASDVSVARMGAMSQRASFADLADRAMRAGVRYSDVQSDGGLLFFREQAPSDRVPKLVVQQAGRDRVLFDPQAGAKGVAAISNYSISPDGRTVAVHVASAGGEIGSAHFIDVASGKETGAPLGPIWGEMPVTWLTSDQIAYTRMSEKPGDDATRDMRVAVLPAGASGTGQFILGPGVADAPPIDPVEFPLVCSAPVSDLVVGQAVGARSDMQVFVSTRGAVVAGKPAWRTLAAYQDEVNAVTALGDAIYVLSTKNAPNGEILRRDIAASALGDPVSVLPAGELVLTDLTSARDGVYVQAQRDGIAHLLFLPGGRGPAREVALPYDADLEFLRTSLDGGSIVFGLMGWSSNFAFYRATGGKVEPVGLVSDSWSGAAGVTTVREEAISADGTHVPMVIELPPGGRRASLPTIMEGYGSYGTNNLSPWYSTTALVWIAHGGAYAYCGTRGGNERGRGWHDDGREANKPKAHADFIACAQTLEAKGYTTPAMLVATGTSAGGLLAPPAALKRPDLFAALISRVGIVNPTRLAVAENGANQFAEMGNPGTKAGFDALAAQDAYLMLDTALDIPDTLVTVGLNDHRVAPWMNAKFAARASARFGDRHLILIRADAEGGHGIGSARDRLVAETADTLAFAWDRTHPEARTVSKPEEKPN